MVFDEFTTDEMVVAGMMASPDMAVMGTINLSPIQFEDMAVRAVFGMIAILTVSHEEVTPHRLWDEGLSFDEDVACRGGLPWLERLFSVGHFVPIELVGMRMADHAIPDLRVLH